MRNRQNNDYAQDGDTLVWQVVSARGMNVTHSFTTGTEAMAWAEEILEEVERS